MEVDLTDDALIHIIEKFEKISNKWEKISTFYTNLKQSPTIGGYSRKQYSQNKTRKNKLRKLI
jgi:hypothetical protein